MAEGGFLRKGGRGPPPCSLFLSLSLSLSLSIAPRRPLDHCRDMGLHGCKPHLPRMRARRKKTKKNPNKGSGGARAGKLRGPRALGHDNLGGETIRTEKGRKQMTQRGRQEENEETGDTPEQKALTSLTGHA